MPILAGEVSVFPPNLLVDFSDLNSRSENEGNVDRQRRWWAVYTRSRQEKSTARQMLSREIPFYLPLVAKRQFIGSRAYCSHLPLFPGYVFAYSTDEQRVHVLSSKHVSRILPVFDPKQLLADLQNIQRLIEADVPLTIERKLKAGDAVRVKRGSFAGLEGTVTRRSGKVRLLIAVSYLQQGVSVEIDDYMLEPI